MGIVEREPAIGTSIASPRAASTASSALSTSRPRPPRQRAGDDELRVGQALQVVDAVFAEMIDADVGDDRRIGTRERQAAPQDAAARGLQHRKFDRRVAQYRACAGRAGVVAGGDLFAIDIEAIRTAMAGAQAGFARDGAQQARGRGLAVAARDERGRDRMKTTPVHVARRRHRVDRPGLRAGAAADAHCVVVDQQRDLMLSRRIGQRDERRPPFARRALAQPGKRHRLLADHERCLIVLLFVLRRAAKAPRACRSRPIR